MLAKKVGIPRALFYYKYYPLWKTFFEELGAEVIVSDSTNKRILNDGVKNCVDEACLPVKLFHGHVLELKDKVDYLFIPRFTSISKGEYICPKFGGLPDMVKHSIRNLPQIINTEINLRKSSRNEMKAALEIGSLFLKDRAKIRKAYRKALGSYNEFNAEILKGVLPGELLDTKRPSAVNIGADSLKIAADSLKIAVIGHIYNLCDSYANMDLINKLRSYGVDIITIDMIDESDINEKSNLLNKKMFWYFGRKAVGGALHLLERKDIDGIIYLMSFGCGVDAFVCDLIERNIRRKSDLPFTTLNIDEHTGEAGLNTRLEAFIDMIRWRNINENNISAFG